MESNIPKKLLSKYKAVENGKCSHIKILESLDEVLIWKNFRHSLLVEEALGEMKTEITSSGNIFRTREKSLHGFVTKNVKSAETLEID